MTGDGGGGSDFVMNSLSNETVKKRVRQYGVKCKEPFLVCVRAVSKPLESMSITKFLHLTYKSKLIIKQINEYKMNIVFHPINENIENIELARKEANEFPYSKWNQNYRIYIPERFVEVIGCVTYSTEENVEDIMNFGKGVFSNSSLSDVNVLEAVRFERIIDEAGMEPRKEMTNTIRVVFDGLLLPDWINVDGLRIPIRKFIRKQMFCESCLKYNHTKSHCNNKPFKAEPTQNKCIHCKTDEHQTGDKKCPKRLMLEKREKAQEKSMQMKTYAQMLEELDPKATLDNEVLETHFPLNLGTGVINLN